MNGEQPGEKLSDEAMPGEELFAVHCPSSFAHGAPYLSSCDVPQLGWGDWYLLIVMSQRVLGTLTRLAAVLTIRKNGDNMWLGGGVRNIVGVQNSLHDLGELPGAADSSHLTFGVLQGDTHHKPGVLNGRHTNERCGISLIAAFFAGRLCGTGFTPDTVPVDLGKRNLPRDRKSVV